MMFLTLASAFIARRFVTLLVTFFWYSTTAGESLITNPINGLLAGYEFNSDLGPAAAAPKRNALLRGTQGAYGAVVPP
jgi:hypothetical protein